MKKKLWENILVQENTPIIQTLKVIDRGALQFAIVIDSNSQVIGTVTDGDIRRGLLKEIQLTSPIKEVMNKNPILASMILSDLELLQLMKKHHLNHIPVVNENKILINLRLLKDIILPEDNDHNVVIMAGGLGSRLGELTKHYPKPLLKIGGKPILETIIENFALQGFKNFYLCVKYKSDLIQDYFGDGSRLGVNIGYIREKNKLGTAGALSLIDINQLPDMPILVMNGDILTKVNFNELLEFHYNNNFVGTMCTREFETQIPYGVVEVCDERIYKIEEKPRQVFNVSAGIYVLNKDILRSIPQNVYCDMPHVFENMLKLHKERVGAFPVHDYWIDIGRQEDFIRADDEFNDHFRNNF